VRAALDAGADAVCVGSAITNVDWLVREFAGAADRIF
jgi:putative N-acetylmannosamine-6-phosphate epimerase